MAMQQILAPTMYRSTSIEPKMVVPTLQAYSLLFGKYEIATEGHFGLFVVNALGAMPPAGGWTQEKALEYLKKEYGAESGYGWSAGAPLCAETFDQALRQILAKVQQTSSIILPAKSNPYSLLFGQALLAQNSLKFDSFGFHAQTAGSRQDSAQAAERKKEVETFITSLRRSGLIPNDRCAIVPAQGLMQLKPAEPLCIDCIPPASPIAPLR
jgi:hypothetical protein